MNLKTYRFSQIGMFAIVGAANTILYFVIANLLVQIGYFSKVPASFVAYLLVMPVSFFGQRQLTFQADGHVMTQCIKFCSLQLVCFCVIALVNWATRDISESASWVGFAAISTAIPIASFVFMRTWVFASSGRV